MNTERYRTLVGIVRDHSASMRGLVSTAIEDYNSLVSEIRNNAIENNQDVLVSVAECGYGNTRQSRIVIDNSSVTVLQPLQGPRSYIADGHGTPLYDSVGSLIELFEKSPYYNDPNTAFLIMVITDGEENSSQYWNKFSLGEKIRTCQMSDRWTFTFRAPRGYGKNIIKNLNLFDGNVIEWELSSHGMKQSSVVTTSAVGSYFTARSTGSTATRSFYTDIKNLSEEEVKSQLIDISSQIQSWIVQTEAEGSAIKEFVEHKLGKPMLKGGAFYELVPGKKSADKVQASKQIIIRDKITKVVYSGQAARDIIGLPKYSDIKVRPGDLGNWQLFIQSTSVNRKMKPGTEIIYWEQVGVPFKS